MSHIRIWDLPPALLCRQHLLGEHRELHAIWTILVENKTGYREHPETKRWMGKLAALYHRHDLLVIEMTNRGYHHKSPLSRKFIHGSAVQDVYVDHPERQKVLLRAKKCDCKI